MLTINPERGRHGCRTLSAQRPDEFQRLLAAAGVDAVDIGQFAADAGFAEGEGGGTEIDAFVALLEEGRTGASENEIGTEAFHLDGLVALGEQRLVEGAQRGGRDRVHRVQPAPPMGPEPDAHETHWRAQRLAKPIGRFVAGIDPGKFVLIHADGAWRAAMVARDGQGREA